MPAGAELADKERQQAAIAHLHIKAERYPGQRAAYPNRHPHAPDLAL
jgi:hypothetical protein